MGDLYNFILRNRSSNDLENFEVDVETHPVYENNEFSKNLKGMKVNKIPLYHLDSLTSVAISLGVNCNIDCQYCFQRKFVGKLDPISNMSFYDIPKFIERFKILWDSIGDRSNLKTVYLWGGEPLMYWKTIKSLVPELEANFPGIERFIISSNGLLLDQEKLEFMSVHKFELQMSDDGNTNHFRGIKVEQDIDKIRNLLVNFIKNHPDFRLQVHATISNKNCNVYNITRNILNVYKDVLSNIVVIPTYTPCNDDNESYQFSEDQLKELFWSTHKSYTEYADWFETHHVTNRLERVSRFIFERNVDVIPEIGFCRHTEGNVITLDKFCNLYGCRDVPFQNNLICTFEQFNPIDYIKLLKKHSFTSIQSKSRCIRCCYRVLCNGICPLMNNKSTMNLCDAHFTFYSAVIKAELERLFPDKELIDIQCNGSSMNVF